MRIAQHLILGGTQTKAPASIAAHNASNAIEFFRAAGKKQLLPLNAADLLCSRPLTKTEEKDTITSTAQAGPLIPEESLS